MKPAEHRDRDEIGGLIREFLKIPEHEQPLLRIVAARYEGRHLVSILNCELAKIIPRMCRIKKDGEKIEVVVRSYQDIEGPKGGGLYIFFWNGPGAVTSDKELVIDSIEVLD